MLSNLLLLYDEASAIRKLNKQHTKIKTQKRKNSLFLFILLELKMNPKTSTLFLYHDTSKSNKLNSKF